MVPIVSDRFPSSSFASVSESFACARQTRVPVHEWHVVIGGHRVRVRCVGVALTARILAALPHRADADAVARVSLDLDLWDEAETGVDAPDRSFQTMARSDDGRFVRFGLGHVSSWLDRTRRRLVASFASAAALGPRDFYQPFGPLLAVWLADMKTPAIHAAAVGRHGRAVLLTGRSGAGKSTTSIACLLEGWDYLGDDFVAIARDRNAGFAVHGVYGMAHLVGSHVRTFPALPEAAVFWPPDAGGKAVIDLAAAFPERVAASAGIRAVVLPRLAGGATSRLRPASKAEAMLAMAPASLFLRGSASPAAFHAMATLVEQVPTCWLDMSTDPSTIPAALRPLLETE